MLRIKNMLIAVAAVAFLAVGASPALAGSPPGDDLHGSPWLTEVPVTVSVAEVTELYMDNSPVSLEITDGGAVNDDSRAVRSVTYLSNVDIDVSVEIEGDTLNGINFYIVVNPDTPAVWDYEFTGNHLAEAVILYHRDGAGAYTGNVPGTLYPAFSRVATPAGETTPIVYAAQIGAPWVVPDAGNTASFTVVWTIAPTL